MRIVKKLIENKKLINTYKFSKLHLINNFNIIFFKKLYFFLLKSKNFIFKKNYIYSCIHARTVAINLKTSMLNKKFIKSFFYKVITFINLYFYKKV